MLACLHGTAVLYGDLMGPGAPWPEGRARAALARSTHSLLRPGIWHRTDSLSLSLSLCLPFYSEGEREGFPTSSRPPTRRGCAPLFGALSSSIQPTGAVLAAQAPTEKSRSSGSLSLSLPSNVATVVLLCFERQWMRGPGTATSASPLSVLFFLFFLWFLGVGVSSLQWLSVRVRRPACLSVGMPVPVGIFSLRQSPSLSLISLASNPGGVSASFLPSTGDESVSSPSLPTRSGALHSLRTRAASEDSDLREAGHFQVQSP